MVAAREAFARAVELAPGLAAARFNLGRAELALENRAAGLAALNDALRIDPEYVNARVLVTELAIDRGDLGAAEANLNLLEATAPDIAAVKFLAADLSLAQERFAEAVQRFQALLEETDSLRAAYGRYQASRLAGDPRALDDLRQWIRASGDEQALVILAQEQQRSGSLADAIETYEAAVEANPESAVALNNLAWLYQEAGDPRALTAAEQAYRLMPESGAIADTLGWIHFQRGDADRALDYLTRAAELAPEEPDIRYHLSVVYAAEGDATRARDEVEILLACDAAVAVHVAAQALLTSL